MRHLIISVLTAAFIFSFSGQARLNGSVGQVFAQGTADKIVAVVNDEIVTQSEVDEMLAVFYMQLASKYSEEELRAKMDEAKESVLNRLIEDKLILHEARELKMEINKAAVDGRFAELKQGFKDRGNFDDLLLQQGLTLPELKKKIEEQLMMSSLVDLKVRRDTRVSPTEITAYYQAHQDEFFSPEVAQVSSIFCRQREKAGQALSAIKNGGDFEEVKKEFSSGSSLSEVKKGELIKEIDEAIFNLGDAEVSGIVSANNGFYIFKLIRKVPAAKLQLSEAEDEIEGKLFNDKLDKRFKAWIDGLKKSAYIEIK